LAGISEAASLLVPPSAVPPVETDAAKVQGQPLLLSPEHYQANILELRVAAAALTKAFTDCNVEQGFAGQHSFIDASAKENIRLIFQFHREIGVPSTSACLLVPDWPNARFNTYLKSAQLLKQYLAGTLQKWPVKLVYMASKSPQLGSMGDDVLTMTFQGSAAGYPAHISADSQASHIFINPEWLKRAHAHVTPIVDSVELGDGRNAKIIGRCSLRLSLGAFHVRIVGLVLQSFSQHHDIILGEEFLSKYKAQLDFAKKAMILNKGARKFTITAANAPGLTPKTDHRESVILSYLQAKRALRKCVDESFLVVVRDPTAGLDPEGDSDDDPLVSLNKKGVSELADSHIKDGPCDRAAIQSLLKKYKHVSPAELPGLPPIRGVETEQVIPLVPGAQPPAPRRYKLSPREKEEVEKHVSMLLQKGLAEPYIGPYGAPVLFVPKPDGSLRMVIDYRALNRLTIKDKYPIPLISDMIDQLRDAKVFSALDLTQGYYQQRLLSDTDRERTSFTAGHLGAFSYTVLPMGLSNSVSVFQRSMNKIFAPFIGKNGFVLVYLDDILIYSKSPEEHLEHLEQVFKVLEDQKLYIRMHKCTFNTTEVKYLGHIVGNNQVKPDPNKIEAVVNWAVPENIPQLRSFLGLVNYFSKFIEKHAAKARPLTDMLRAGVPFNMYTPERMGAFNELKAALTSAPVLAIPDMSKPFKVVVDASQFDLSGILLQDEKPVAYESRKLKAAECNYPTHEREMLAAVHCLRTWRCYLDGPQPFKLYTDHKPLTLFDDQPRISSRQARWLQLFSTFDFEWHYTKGVANPADFLTRMPTKQRVLQMLTRYQQRLKGQSASSQVGGEEPVQKALPKRSRGDSAQDAPAPSLKKKQKVVKPPLPDKPADQATAPDRHAQIVAAIALDPWFSDTSNLKSLTCKNGLYYLNGKLVIPADDKLKSAIIAECHDPPSKGHPGIARTAEHLLRHYWWPGLARDVKNFVLKCSDCQRNKSRTVKPGGLLQPMPIPESKWESVGMDFIVGLPCTEAGFDSILVVIDRLSKMVHLIPTTSTVTAAEVAKLFVENIVKLHGVPKSIVSDRDKNFTSIFWQTVCQLWGIKQRMSTAFHPQTDGQTERVNRVLEEYLRSYVNPMQDDWDRYLPMAEFAFNDSYHSSTGTTPFYMTYGYHPRMPDDLEKALQDNPAGYDFVGNIQAAVRNAREQLKQAQNRQKTYADSKRRAQSFEPGDLVLLSTTNLRLKVPGSQKLLPRYIGPFAIEKKAGTAAYKLALPSSMRVHPVFHVSLMHEYRADGKVQPPPPLFFDDGVPFYEVEAVMKHREVKRGKRVVKQYLIKWAGYGPEHNTWEPEKHLNKACLDAYWKPPS
jgi:hypothetical protein